MINVACVKHVLIQLILINKKDNFVYFLQYFFLPKVTFFFLSIYAAALIMPWILSVMFIHVLRDEFQQCWLF